MATPITGTSGADTITGLAGKDTLNGGGGNDTYIIKSLLNTVVELLPSTGSALSGAAAMAAYGGIDTIQTSVLNSAKTFGLDSYAYVENLSYTGTVAAQLKGNALNNQIKANSATSTNDTLYGGAGNDSLYGYGGNDLLQGGAGHDSLDGGAGKDTLVGGAGNDCYVVTDFDVVLEINGGGFDTVMVTDTGGRYLDLRNAAARHLEGLSYNSTTAQTLHGNDASNLIESKAATGNDTLKGWAGDDTLKGGGGNDALDGGSGNDDLYGQAGADTLVGGLGHDLYFVDATDTVQEDVGAGIDTLIGTVTSLSTSAYATTLENLIYTGSTGSALQGNDLDNWLVGSSGGDTLNASAGNDTLIGGKGADSLQGGAGNDVLYGGNVTNIQDRGLLYSNLSDESNRANPPEPVAVDDASADTLVGGAGSDTYYLDNTDDRITESALDAGLDVIRSLVDVSLADYANIEALVLDDRLSPDAALAWLAEGNDADNLIVGNRGENYLSGQGGNDLLCGLGTTLIIMSEVPVTDVLDGGDGDDVLWEKYTGYYPNDYLMGSILLGGTGNDLYLIDTGHTSLHDSGGTDTAYLTVDVSLAGDTGVEVIVLEGGNATYDNQADTAWAKFAQLGSEYERYEDPYATNSAAYNTTGNDLDNTIYGNGNNNQLAGGAGNDSILGGNGNDTLIGDAGIDTLVGGSGNDTYDIDTGDVVVETADGGTDTIRSATLTSYAGYANIEGLYYSGSTSVLLQNSSSNTSADILGGGLGNDTVKGWGGGDTLSGGLGHDLLQGGDGNDNLSGNEGNDSLSGDAGDDLLLGGLGDDSLSGGMGSDTLMGGDGKNILTGGDGTDYLYATDTNYIFPSSAIGSLLQGNAGADSLNGALGNDTLMGGADSDSIMGEAGNDSITGDDGNDNLQAGSGNDTIYGGAGNDTVYAGDGNDVIYAGGVDVTGASVYGTVGGYLYGDSIDYNAIPGDDIFRFDNSSASAATSVSYYPNYFCAGTVISDFGRGNDKIQFEKTMTGDNDNLLENAATVSGTNAGFAKNAELVIFSTAITSSLNISSWFSGISANAITAAGGDTSAPIGTASAAFAVGDHRLFVVNDGAGSAIFQFTSANTDAVVTADELKLVALVASRADLVVSDFGLY